MRLKPTVASRFPYIKVDRSPALCLPFRLRQPTVGKNSYIVSIANVHNVTLPGLRFVQVLLPGAFRTTTKRLCLSKTPGSNLNAIADQLSPPRPCTRRGHIHGR